MCVCGKGFGFEFAALITLLFSKLVCSVSMATVCVVGLLLASLPPSWHGLKRRRRVCVHAWGSCCCCCVKISPEFEAR
jgi:hypothetical protein